MSTGHAQLDFQHQTLFEKFNELGLAMENKNTQEQIEMAGSILDYLEFYADWHFRQEEELMEALNCPAAARNKTDHAEFHTRFSDLRSRWLNSDMDGSLALGVFDELTNWISDHILKVDTQLRV